MSRYLVHRSDANAEKVYAALKAAGVHVERIGRPVDAIIFVTFSFDIFETRLSEFNIHYELLNGWFFGMHSRMSSFTMLAEVKTAKGKTRSKAQAAFLKRWPGPVLILRSA